MIADTVEYEIELRGGPCHGTVRRWAGELVERVEVHLPNYQSGVLKTSGMAELYRREFVHSYLRDEAFQDGPAVFRFIGTIERDYRRFD